MTFKNYNQKQDFLLPPNFEVFLGESHQAVILNEFIDELDTTNLIESYNNQYGGSSAYHPVMLLKILIYAYSNATFSSRMMANKLKEDIAFMFLAGNNTPDFRTISRFRQQKAEFIAEIFAQTVAKAKDLGLVTFGTCSLDGTKIYANASREKNFDESRLEVMIHGLIQKAEDIDAIEDELYGDNEDDIDPKLKTKEGRKKRKQQIKEKENRAKEALRQIPNPQESRSKSKSKPKPKRNTTDPDSRLMKMKRKDFANGFNVQNMTENGIILVNYIDNSSADQKTLIPTVKKLKRIQQTIPKKLLADKGYSTWNNYAFCEKKVINTYIPPCHEGLDISKYRYNRKNDTYTDKQGRIFIFKQHMKRKHGKAQRGRPKASTQGTRGNRHMYRYVTYQYIDHKTGKNKFISIDHDWITYCKRQKKKLSTPYGKKLYKRRCYDVEGVFANIKKNLKFTHFNLRGLKGVKTEWNLMSIVHNIQKIAA
jgi:transposase